MIPPTKICFSWSFALLGHSPSLLLISLPRKIRKGMENRFKGFKKFA
jgi:hypothetical protein